MIPQRRRANARVYSAQARERREAEFQFYREQNTLLTVRGCMFCVCVSMYINTHTHIYMYVYIYYLKPVLLKHGPVLHTPN